MTDAPTLTTTTAFLSRAAALCRWALNTNHGHTGRLPHTHGLLIMQANTHALTAAIGTGAALRLTNAIRDHDQSLSLACHPHLFLQWYETHWSKTDNEPEAIVRLTYQGGMLWLGEVLRSPGLCCVSAEPLDLNPIVISALLGGYAPGSLSNQVAVIAADPAEWLVMSAGSYIGCLARCGPDAIDIVDPEADEPGRRVESPKRNWLRELPANLRPDETRSLHRMSKTQRKPIRRIVTEAVRDVIDQERNARHR